MKSSELAAFEKLIARLRELANDKFFGEIVVSFQNGKPHTIKVNRVYKIDQL